MGQIVNKVDNGVPSSIPSLEAEAELNASGQLINPATSENQAAMIALLQGGTAVIQNAQVVAANSSTANLSALATFTGTSVSTLNVNSIQVTLHTDQNCTVWIDQSSNGTNWDITDSYNYNVIKNNFGVTTMAVAAYFRVRVKNLSSTTATTSFRLQSILCPIADALPRSIGPDGHLQVDINGLHDDFGFSGEFTPMRDLKICEPVRMIGTTFGASIDANFWTATNSGAASASGVSGGMATISSGTANSGYGTLETVRIARFQFAHPHMYRALIRVTSATVALNTRRWGSFSQSTRTPQNGCYFELSAAGVLSVVTVNGGTPTAVSSGSFNGTVSEYTMDTNIHAYEIVHFTAGAWFYIDNVLIHTVVPTTGLLYQTLNVPIGVQSINTASGVTSGTIECWNSSVLKLGREITSPASSFRSTTTAGQTLKSGAGVLNRIALSAITNTSNVTYYDNTAASGTILWQSGAMGNNTLPFSLELDIPFFTGLTLVVASAASNVTTVYE